MSIFLLLCVSKENAVTVSVCYILMCIFSILGLGPVCPPAGPNMYACIYIYLPSGACCAVCGRTIDMEADTSLLAGYWEGQGWPVSKFK